MSPEMIILCIAIIAVGVGVIAYVLLHGPKEAAHIGSPAEISLGEEPDADDASEEEDGAPAAAAQDTEETDA